MILKVLLMKDLCKVKEHASEFQSIFCLKSQIEGHRIHQLGSTAGLACVWLNFAKLAGGFYDLKSRISSKKISFLYKMCVFTH